MSHQCHVLHPGRDIVRHVLFHVRGELGTMLPKQVVLQRPKRCKLKNDQVRFAYRDNAIDSNNVDVPLNPNKTINIERTSV